MTLDTALSEGTAGSDDVDDDDVSMVDWIRDSAERR